MAAPVRYLSGRQQQQKIGIEGSTQDEKVLEVVGRVGIGTTIFEPSEELDVRGDVNISGQLTVGGNTFGVDTETRNLNVSGVSTFTGAIDANGDIDVDGHTELDDVNVSGVSTFIGVIDANGGINVTTAKVEDLTENRIVIVGGAGTASQTQSSVTFTSVSDDNLTLTNGTNADISMIGNHPAGPVYANAENRNPSVTWDFNTSSLPAGVSVGSYSVLLEDLRAVDGNGDALVHWSVSGIAATITSIPANAAANDITGATINNNFNMTAFGQGVGTAGVSIVGYSGPQPATNENHIYRLSVTAQLSGGSTATLTQGIEFNFNTANTLTANPTPTTAAADNLAFTYTLAGGGELEDDANLTFDGTQLAVGVNLDVDGHTELDDVNVSGAITATTFTGNLAGTVNTAAQPNITSLGTLTGLDVNGHSELDDVNVSGASTFTGAIDANGSLDVDGHTELDDVNVSGASTFTGAIDANGDVDIDGHTELDDVNVSGASTFASVNVSGFSTFAGITTVTGDTLFSKQLNVSGVSTFVGLVTVTTGDVHIANRLFVGGLEVEGGGEGTFTGINTFTNQTDNVLGNSDTGAVHFNGGVGIDKNLTVGAGLSVVAGFEVGGVSTFTGNIDANGNLDVDGQTDLDVLNVAELATFTGNIDANGDLDVDGHTELDNVNASGISSATAFANFDYLQAPFGSTVSFTVTVASKDASHRYNGTGSGSAYLINGIQSPFLTLTPGRTYRFNLSASDQSNHPFRFYLEADKTTQYTTNVTTAATYTEITIGDETPVVLHYQCSAHEYMGNAVQTNSNVVNTNYNAILRGGLDVDGHTELDDVNVSGASTFTGAIDANGGLDVSGATLNVSSGLVANSARVSDLTDNRIVIAGASGELEDSSKLTFDGTTLAIVGDATFTGNVSIAGTLTKEDVTDIDSIGLVTARTGVRITSGGLVVSSGVSTFVDNIIGNLTGTATTATNIAGGDTGDIPYQSAANTTTFVDASTASVGQVLVWGGSAPAWSPVSAASGNFGGITLQEEGSTVGTAASVTGLNFIGSNVTAAAGSGHVVGSVTISDTPTFDSLKVIGISTIPSVTGPTTFTGGDVNVGAAVTIDPTSGIISATAFFGSGENLTDLINQRIEGLQIFDEGTAVGTGYSFSALNFVGNGVSVAAVGLGTTATVTIEGFSSDADENLFAGTCAGGTYDPSSASACFNVFIGSCAGKDITEGDNNVVLGNGAGCCMTNCNSNVFIGYQAGNKNDGSYNIFFGYRAGKGSATASSNTGGHNIAMGMDAGEGITIGTHNVFLGLNAGYKNTEGSCNVFLGHDAGCLTTSGDNNVYIGQEAGKTGETAHTNIAIGKMAAQNATGFNNVVLGDRAGRDLTGYSNVIIGQTAGVYGTSGERNVFLGAYSAQCTSGNDNVILGTQSGKHATTGCYNVFFGKSAAAGGPSNNGSTGNHNIVMGCEAGLCLTSGANNIFLGQEAGKKILDGVDNVAIGQHAGCAVTSGCYNVFLGSNAGCTNTSGDSNIAIGKDVILPSDTADKQLAIGNGSDRWITGDSAFNVTVSTASTFSSDGINVVGVVTATDFNSTSDARLKTNVQVIPDPLDKIVRIDGVSFNWIKDNKPSMGVIADNIQEVLPELVSDTDPKTVNYNGLIGLLIEVVKDQQTQINSLNERLSQLE